MDKISLLLIDNLQQVAADLVDYILDEDHQAYILKLLTGVDILNKNEKNAPVDLLKLICDYFINYAFTEDAVNTVLLYGLIANIPQYNDCRDKENLAYATKIRLKELFLLRVKSILEDEYNNIVRRKIRSGLIDSFLKKKF